MSWIWHFLVILCFLWSLVIARYAYVDTSEERCKGCVSNFAVRKKMSSFASGDDSRNYLCLRSCVLQRAKIAAFSQGQACYCTNDTLLAADSEVNSTCCYRVAGYNSAKIYSLTGIIVQFRFEEFVEQNKIMTLDREILLCNTGTFVRNRTMVDQLLTWYNCTTIQYTRSSRSLHREQKVLNISCLANFSLKDLGESRICIGCGNSGVCRATGDHGYGIVKVLAPVKIVEPKKTKLRLNYPWKTVINVTVTGTVFNLSHDIGGQEVNAMTDLEPSLYEICQIEWPIPYNFTSLGSYTFTIRASNPLSKETRTVSVECNLDFVVDTASEVWNASNYVTWLEVFHAPVEEMLTYKWTSRDCNEVRIVQNVTTVPSTRIISASNVSIHGCRIDITLLRKDGVQIGHKTKRLSDKRFRPEISVSSDYIQTNSSATFQLKPDPLKKGCCYCWKINGSNCLSNWTLHILHYSFDHPGRYNVSVTRCGNLTDYKMVIVQDPISKLTISTSSGIAGSSVTFNTFVMPREAVNFEWDFGDGEKSNTTESIVKHIYGTPKVYEVTLTAKNNVSSKTVTETINVTALCPTFEVETSFENQVEVKVNRSQPIFEEIGVKSLKCHENVKLKYIWKMSKLEGSRWIDIHLENQDVNKKTHGIYIPSNTLEYKKYRLQVFVNLSRLSSRTTIERAEEHSTIIDVIRSPLKAIIRGGFARFVSNVTKSITMDATMSVDPDNPGERGHLQFSWNCTSKPTHATCFKNDGAFKNLSFIIRDFNLSDFKDDGSPYEFKLVVSDNVTDKQRSSHAVQMVYVDANSYGDVILDCPTCTGSDLNPSNPVVIIPRCQNCGPKKNSKPWSIYEYNGEIEDLYFKVTKCNQNSFEQAISGNQTTIKRTKLCGEGSASGRSTEVKKLICGEYREVFCQQSSNERRLHEDHVDKKDTTMIVIKKNILPQNKFLRIEFNPVSGDPLALRFLHVQERPARTGCRVIPETGVELLQNFRLSCNDLGHKNDLLLYKVLFKRENSDGTTMPNIMFQGSLSFFDFQLPSGYNNTVKYSLQLWIENKFGVTSEHCPIEVNVTAINPDGGQVIEEFLYNQTMTIKEVFHGHKHAYHGPTLHNVTILADVLNRQPTAGIHASKFHLRTLIRMYLINILNRTEVFGEYVIRQFASSLESCTRVSDELNNVSIVTAIEVLHRVLTGKNRLFERRMDIPDKLMDNVVVVASRLLVKIAEVSENEYHRKIADTLENLFKARLRAMRVEERRIDIKKPPFNATLLKFSQYDNESLTLKCGNVHLTLSHKVHRPVSRCYCHDVYGYGLQAVVFSANPFDSNNTFHRISPTVKLNTHGCDNCGGKNDNSMKVKIEFPRKKSKVPIWTQTDEFSISPNEIHHFVMNRSDNSNLEVELFCRDSMPLKSELRMNMSCADQKKGHGFSSSDLTHQNHLRKVFSWKQLTDCGEKLSVFIGIHWDIPPNRAEQVNTVIKYAVVLKWITCLSWNRYESKWSDQNCKPELVAGHFLTCSCSKITLGYIAGMKKLPHSFQKITTSGGSSNVMWIIVSMLSSSYVAAIIFLFYLERQEQIRQRSFIALAPSDPSHTHKYQVSVYTGHVFGAGTTAKVGLVLYGEQNSSYPIELSMENYPLFRRNSRDIFIVSVREKLGPLSGIHLWHDNSGCSPSWFVEKLIIKDLSSEEKWMFKCCRWLAVDKHDKKLDCKIKPYEGKPEFTFKEFGFEFGKKFMDFHLWLSLLGMPSYSLFRRTERLTCCVLMVIVYLYLNAFFYQSSDHLKSMDCISSLNPTWSQFEIGGLSALIVIPIHLFISVTCRFTKPTRTRKVVPFRFSFGEDQLSQKTSKNSLPSLEKCVSVILELHHKPNRNVQQINEAAEQRALQDLIYEVNETSSEINGKFGKPDILTGNDDESLILAQSSTADSAVYPRIIDHEITSQGSGSYMSFQNSERFRFPVGFSIFMWIGSITTSAFAAYLTIDYTFRFDAPTLVCYAQSVCWSLFLSFCVFQPLKVLIVTTTGMWLRHLYFRDEYIGDPAEEAGSGGKTLLITDYMNIDSDEVDETPEDVAYHKSLYLKYLRPLSKKELSRARLRLEKRNQTWARIRDLMLYSFILVLLYIMTSRGDQQSIFLHNQGLKLFLTRQTNASSFLTWWSTSPQKILDTLEFKSDHPTGGSKSSGILTGLSGRALIVGNPKVTMTTKYCRNLSTEEMGYISRHCSIHEMETTIPLNESQKNNWMDLSDYIYKHLNQHVKAVSLDFVIYFPSLNVFSALKLSAKVLVTSSLHSDFVIRTFQFFVDGTSGIVDTIYQVLFTLVPVLLIFRQMCSGSHVKKIRHDFCLQLELFIIILSMFSFVVLWTWIKSQYSALVLIRDMSYKADLITSAETVHDYQEWLRSILGLLQFLIFLKVCQIAGLGKLLSFYSVTLPKVLNQVFMPLFSLIVLLVAFSHTGTLLFSGYLESFSTFVKALSLNIIYLKEINVENLLLDNSRETVLLCLYVICFCVSVGFVSCLVKAAFCQVHLHCMPTVNKKKLSVKTMFIRLLRRIQSYAIQYSKNSARTEPKKKPVIPMRYILKELNEQLDELLFRLVNLFALENMPTKNDPMCESTSSESSYGKVEYVYRMKNNVRPNHPPDIMEDVSPLSDENMDESKTDNFGDTTSGSLLTHDPGEAFLSTRFRIAETDAASVRLNLFERGTYAFPKPIGADESLSSRTDVCLDAFAEDEPNLTIDDSIETIADLIPKPGKDEKPLPEHSLKFQRPPFPEPISVLFGPSTRIEYVASDSSDQEI